MYDLHTHSLLSDGELLPSELARRYEVKGYKAIAITDHVDASNIKSVVKAITDFCRRWPKNRIKVLPGIELTHIPLEQFKSLTKYARSNGIKIIVAHGETTVEPVIKGTNRKAINSDIDILAHPGLISEEDAKLAKAKGVFLEITTRKGHGNTNKHVLKIAKKYGNKIILDNDSHNPDNILSVLMLKKQALEYGISQNELAEIWKNVQKKILSCSY